ncbi:ferrous iron transport protein B [Methanomicrobium sp. W14]|uniref:ferrous iron transport protein B n=1 Tax=Methanomicrobium sp. W14 TaxID=2817839 RepID=UPI001AE54E5B|nr:ferrous iron transport protein B [Methanomicrobium sp. W14]MBP2134479.1 ferrous iron transport protein B [Methanomicrobium sp. W14]
MKFGLIGNPNVGKSLIFNLLTGIGVEISNFPGTTIGMLSGNVCYQREKFEVVDFPGIYSLDGLSEEETEARRFLLRKEADVLIAVLDASRLERNLYLLLQIAEYQIPAIIVLNMMDEAEKKGIFIDTKKLSETLGCEVIPAAATEGKNIEKIIPCALENAKIPSYRVSYDQHIEAALKSLQKILKCERIEAILALEGIGTDKELLDDAQAVRDEIEEQHRMSVHQIIAANRHNEAEKISESVVKSEGRSVSKNIDRLLTRTIPGVPIMAVVLISTLLCVFFIGSFLEETIVGLFDTFLINPMYSAGLSPFSEEIVFSVLIAVEAGLGVAFPYVFTFYILISILEDTGYMTRASFLADRAMHKIGMHGQALIPMVLGFGCNVPAIMSIRQLSKRERIIASFLITMVPCSARTVIIAGIVAAFVGILPALSIYLIIFVLIILTGLVLTKFAPGDQFGMILEIVPMRKPRMKQTLQRAWLRMKEFLFIAMPLLIVSSVILGVLQYTGIINSFQSIFAPFMEAALGLPDYASTALLFGILRKEMAFETLAILAGTANLGSVLTGAQLYIFAIVSVLFVPCISTIAVLYREMGLKIAAAVSFYTLSLGVVAGVILNMIL